jgi:peptide/nickel transport system substrate-binding protein
MLSPFRRLFHKPDARETHSSIRPRNYSKSSDPRRRASAPKRWAGRSLLLVAACAILASGCHRKSAGERDTVNFLIESAPTNLDPRIGIDSFSESIDGLIFDSLVAHDQRLNVVPDLAQKWDTPDPLTYVFHLRRGVSFHDGRLLTSADVKFTFDSILSGAVATEKRGPFQAIQSVEAPDPQTVIFHMREPDASFLWNLTRPQIGIVPQGSAPDVSKHPVGTGVFRFVSGRTGKEIVLERNSKYFGGAADIPLVRFRVVPDVNERVLQLRNGTGDVALNSFSPDMVVAFQQEHDVTVEDQAGTTVEYIAFNFDDPILAHREVRQALTYATDRQTLIQNLLRGMAIPATQLLPANHWAYETKVMQYDYKPAQAEKLLDAAGFKRGRDGVRFHVALKMPDDQSTRQLGDALVAEWKRVGVALDRQPLDIDAFYSDITRGSFQLYTVRVTGGNNDPDIFEHVYSSKKMPPNGANRGHYKNPQLDALLDQLRVEMDLKKRKQLLSEIQKTLAVDQPYLMLWYIDNICVHRNRLTNIVIPPVGDYDFLDLARLQEAPR